MAGPNFPKSIPSFFKKINIYPLVFLSLLCSLSYMFSIYIHKPPTIIVDNHQIPCPSLSSSSSSPSIIKSNTTHISNSPILDFSTHHSAEDSITALELKPKHRNFPPCGFNFTEYTPCEDTNRSLNYPRENYIYRERHCPSKSEVLKCRIPAPFGYKNPFQWPISRDYAWYANVPHKHLTVEKAGQNWIRYEGQRFRFPGGGTMFPNGADSYIDDIDKLINLKDGSIRTAIDTGCGVASWGAYLLSRDILPISFAPKDTHEAQVQFALERGVPALIGILASMRLPYPSRAFDMAHCSRCLIPWADQEGLYLMEVDRILRPGGYWILSGPPINWKSHYVGWQRTKEDLNAEQTKIEEVAKRLCWKKVVEKNDIAIWQKPTNHIHCKMNRKVIKRPPFCQAQDPDRAWYTKMNTCLTPLPDVSNIKDVAGGKLAKWPKRLNAIPPRISSGSLKGITEKMFEEDIKLWKKRIAYYKNVNNQLGQKGRYRNVVDMNANLGGFAASLIDYPLWVMNVVPSEAKIDTLGAIYERGLIGTYQNWCEAMSTYPRTYDLLHADSLFTLYKDRCDMEDILLEMDRILRPEGAVIIRDDVDIILQIKTITDGMQWNSQVIDHEDSPHNREKILFAVKMYWTAPKEEKQPNPVS